MSNCLQIYDSQAIKTVINGMKWYYEPLSTVQAGIINAQCGQARLLFFDSSHGRLLSCGECYGVGNMDADEQKQCLAVTVSNGNYS